MGNVYEFSDRATIEQEACEWLIRLDSETPLADADIKALREWIARSPAHGQELKRIFRFWNRANILTELAIPLQEAGDYRATGFFNSWICRPGTRPRRLRVAVAIFLLSVTVALTSWVIHRPDIHTNGIYGTTVGQQQTLVLADGSTVQLNTDSQIQVDYSQQLRKIRLLRGEAHFDVKHNPNRPFEVFAGTGMVKAVGTAFSVYLKDNIVKVTVTEGLIDLAAVELEPDRTVPADKPRVDGLDSLNAGQTATFSNVTRTIATKDLLPEQELQRLMSWRDGYLVFAGDPLGDVVAEVGRYTPLTIEIASPELESLPVGGRFKVGDLNAIFDVLESSFGIKVVHLGDQHIRLQLSQNQ